jgi:hypothetical protein
MSTIYSWNQSEVSATATAAGDQLLLYDVTTKAFKRATSSLMTPYTGRYRFYTIQGNLGTLASLGTSTTVTANMTYYADIFIPTAGIVLQGGAWLNGTTATTDKAILTFHSSTGTLLANTTVASSGTTVASANVFQQVAFTAAYTVVTPGRYWIGYQQSGATATPRTIATATWLDVLSGKAAGTVGVAATSITPPTTFAADEGPIAYVYSTPD